MKTDNFTTHIKRLGIWLLIPFLIVACSSDEKSYDDNELKIEVHKDRNIYAEGDTLTISLSQEGAQTEVADSWLKASVEGKTVTLVVDSNNSYEGRTSVLTIKIGGKSYNLPITQLGRISKISIDSHQFSYLGETTAFLCNTTDVVTLDGLDTSWLSYRIANDSLYITASEMAPFSSINTDTLTCTVNVSVGLFSKQVVFSQIRPPLSYEDILGEYTMEYTGYFNPTTPKTLDVTFEVDTIGKSYTITGLPFALVAKYDAVQAAFTIDPQVAGIESLNPISLYRYYAITPPNADEMGLSVEASSGQISEWNQSKTNMEFKMIPKNDPDTNPAAATESGSAPTYKGFIIIGKKLYSGESSFINIVFKKKSS